MKKYFIRMPLTQWFIVSPRWVYNIWPWAGIVEFQRNSATVNTCSLPSNDDDIVGIYKYLCWSAKNAGMSSDVFHYLEVLKNKADELNSYKRTNYEPKSYSTGA